jgi:protease I
MRAMRDGMTTSEVNIRRPVRLGLSYGGGSGGRNLKFLNGRAGPVQKQICAPGPRRIFYFFTFLFARQAAHLLGSAAKCHNQSPMRIDPEGACKGTIGVLIEDHFDVTEFRKFNDYFPRQGYAVEYLTYLWGNPKLKFGGNPDNGVVEEHVEVDVDVTHVLPESYKGIIIIGAYASDRLRYEVKPQAGVPNQAPAVEFIRRTVKSPGVKLGAICHSLWLLCADNALLQGRKVTCAHNIIPDVRNAGAEIIYGQDGTAELVVDGDLISGKHPGITDQFMEMFLAQIENRGAQPAAK